MILTVYNDILIQICFTILYIIQFVFNYIFINIWSFFNLTIIFQKHSWSGKNDFFIKGNLDSIVFGAGGGSYGLWLDGDLYHGRTRSCETFDNPILSDVEDFTVKGVEIYSLDWTSRIHGFYYHWKHVQTHNLITTLLITPFLVTAYQTLCV